ncbi:MAG: SBBP repeat-containing protein, partial [Bryobacterales bacterium]|nr:SBBP repeat-containing protein [Bryobacterales bacterium]
MKRAILLLGFGALRLHPFPLAPRFEANLGQAGPEARFVVRGSSYTLLVRADGSMIYWLAPRREQEEPVPVTVELAGANPAPEIAAEERLPGVTHYFRGADPRGWIREVPAWARVRCRNVYPGIDLLYRGSEGSIEFDFLVAPGAEPGRIRLVLAGVTSARVDASGDLVMAAGGTELRWRRPKAWQQIEGRRREVSVAFRVEQAAVSFALGSYSPGHELIIDPVVRYSTYLGGGQYDQGWSVAADTAGAAYVAGDTWSTQFPASGTSAAVRASRDAFVAKLDPSGAQLQYLVFLGGGANDSARAIAADAAGNAYVTGVTSSMDFPTTPGAWRRTHGGMEDGFAVKLNPTGTVAWATYVGAGASDYALAIAVDGEAAVYVAGYTASVSFPVTGGAYQTSYRGGSNDAFVVKLNPTGSAALYATLLGGSGNDVANGLGVDANGNVWVGGQTTSRDFPLVAAAQGQFGGESDGFVAKLNSAGSALLYSSYLGGLASDAVRAVAVDAAGACYVAGGTYSSNFPVTASAPQRAIAGGYDAFLAKIGPAGGAPVVSTYLGGRDADEAMAIRVDGTGNVWVAGFTRSPDFPRVGASSSYRGDDDGFVAVLNAAGAAFTSTALIGGSTQDRIQGLALDGSGNAYVTGATLSSDFPVTSGVFRTSPAGGGDAFLAKLSVNLPPQALSVTPSSGSGWSQVFQFRFSDPNGAGDLRYLFVLFHREVRGDSGCLPHYDGSRLWLLDDTGSAWLGPLIPGSNGTLENSQCVLGGLGSAATASGNDLVLQLALTFKAGFAGNKTVYMQAIDWAGLDTRMQARGSWTVGSGVNQPPVAVSVNPSSGSGWSQIFRFAFTDPNGAGDLRYLFVLFHRE